MERPIVNLNKNRIRNVATGVIVLTSAAFWACTDRTQPSIPTAVPTASATVDIDAILKSVPATPEPPKPLTEKEFNLAASQIADTRTLVNDFVNTPLLKKYNSSAILDLPLPSDKLFNVAVDNWARYKKSVDPNGNQYYTLLAGPRGILHYQIKSAYDESGKNIQSFIVVDLSSRSDYKKVLLEIGRFFELPIKQANLAPLAATLFNLPTNLIWKPTFTQPENGLIIPALHADFTSSEGSASVLIDAMGHMRLSVVHTAKTPDSSTSQPRIQAH